MPEANMPIDPELDNENLVNGMLGMRTSAKLLGTFRRELEEEGFDSEETHELCQVWLEAALEKS
jgi:hypothetical protein